MDASCGPSNALSQLSKHTQRDTSLQHERVGGPAHLNQNSFRNQPAIDQNLNVDFHRFSSGNINAQDSRIHAQNAHFRHQEAHQHQGSFNPQNQGWILDFNTLSIANQQNSAQNAGWHQQFMQQQKNQSQESRLQQQGTHHHPQQQFGGQFQRYQPMMMQQQQFSQAQQQHNQLDSLQIDNAALDSQFDQIERELAAKVEEETAEEIMVEDDSDNQKFAEAAMQVRHSMTSDLALRSEETASKFQQSNFLKLMSRISEREVEISKDGHKLVTKQSGEDIRDYLSDPLRHEKKELEQPDYHAPVQDFHLNEGPAPRVTTESQNVISHLPDPLAHIKDGQLPDNLSSLEAARVISGGQVQGSLWMEDMNWEQPPPQPRAARSRGGLLSPEEQEVYDDYRNHDDAF